MPNAEKPHSKSQPYSLPSTGRTYRSASAAHNSTSGNEYQTFAFKPYAAYDAASAVLGEPTRYRVWERISGNHVIGRSWPGSQPVVAASGFDRQADLLAR